MPTVAIDVIVRYFADKVEVQNDLMWYDAVDKHLHRFKSGKLNYEYVQFPDNLEVNVPGMGWVPGKTCVTAEKLYATGSKREDNTKDILKWVNDYTDDFNLQTISVDNREVVVSFKKDKKGETTIRDGLEASLYAKRLRYEIEDD